MRTRISKRRSTSLKRKSDSMFALISLDLFVIHHYSPYNIIIRYIDIIISGKVLAH